MIYLKKWYTNIVTWLMDKNKKLWLKKEIMSNKNMVIKLIINIWQLKWNSTINYSSHLKNTMEKVYVEIFNQNVYSKHVKNVPKNSLFFHIYLY